MTRLIEGGDGRVRAAEIKVFTKIGVPTTLKRPIQQLYLLEVREPQREEVQTDPSQEEYDSTEDINQHGPEEADQDLDQYYVKTREP